MRAAVITEAGAAPIYADFADPEPHDAEVPMRLVAAGIHQIVRSLAAGTHYGSTGAYPLVPGVDAVGLAPDGSLQYTGFVRAPWGTMAEAFAARPGIPLPQGADPALVAGALNPGMSGWMPLVKRKNEIGELGTVLVVGATGSAGGLAAQSALALGASRVIGVGRNPAALEVLGREGVVPVSLHDGASAIAEALDGTAPSLVLDYVWGAAAEAVWEALDRRGLSDDDADIAHVQIGGLGGATAALPAQLLRSRRITVSGSGMGSARIEQVFAELPQLIGKLASGELQLPVRTFGLSHIADAWAHRGPERAVVVPD